MSGASALARVDRACAQLRRDGEPVTFTAVAAITGLGRTTLYRNPAMRAVIDDHRRRTDGSGTLAGITDEITLLRTALDALANRVRRHEEQIRKLASTSQRR
jgi:hypothetical protein